MKVYSQPRTPSRLSDSLNHQLNMYALAASAAGVGVLALAQPTEAKIIYSKTHRVIGPGQHYKLDLNHDKVTDFTFYNTTKWRTELNAQYLGLRRAVSGNSAVGYPLSGYWHIASALKKGSAIGPDRQFLQSNTATMVILSGAGIRGPWYNVRDRYLGLRFRIGEKTHYAWARWSVTGKYPAMAGTLTGYAYETIPNKPIIAGKTKGLDVITVQLGSLGRLAQGSAGLMARRKD